MLQGIEDAMAGARNIVERATQFRNDKSGTPSGSPMTPQQKQNTLGARVKGIFGKGSRAAAPAATAPASAEGGPMRMHKGGVVPGKKGQEVPIIAEAGEKITPMAEEKEVKQKTVKVGDVLAKDKAPKAESKTKDAKTAKKKHKHTHIEHHDDGSHTVRHSGAGDEVSYSKPDLDGVHDGLEEHVGEGNADEAQAMPSAEPQDMQTQAQPQAGAPQAV